MCSHILDRKGEIRILRRLRSGGVGIGTLATQRRRTKLVLRKTAFVLGICSSLAVSASFAAQEGTVPGGTRPADKVAAAKPGAPGADTTKAGTATASLTKPTNELP